MRKRHVVSTLAFVLLTLVLLWSCDMLGIVSIPERIAKFQGALNSDRANIYTNFDQATTQDYSAIAGSGGIGFWDTNFPAPVSGGPQYLVSLANYSDPANVTGTITGPVAFDASGNGYSITFVMVQVGLNYLIQKLYIPNSTSPAIQVRRIN